MTGNAYNVPVVILRYFNVFGVGQSLSNPYAGVLSIFAALLLGNKTIEIYEDGCILRNFVPIEQVVYANIKALSIDSREALILNIGSGEPKTILDVAECLKDKIGSKSRIEVTYRYRLGDIRHCYADTSRTESFIQKQPAWTFDLCLGKLVCWAKTQEGLTELGKSLAELSGLGLSGLASRG